MTKIQYYTAASVDGFIADEHNSLDWLFEVNSAGNAGFERFFANVGAFAMGATTYEWVLHHEDLLAKPERWRTWYGDTPCWVFTHRQLPVITGANITFVSGDVRTSHTDMRTAAGDKNIWLVGGGELVGTFTDAGFLDEIILTLAPVTLGAGAPLLPRRLTAKNLNLTAVEQIDQFVQLTYQVHHLAE